MGIDLHLHGLQHKNKATSITVAHNLPKPSIDIPMYIKWVLYLIVYQIISFFSITLIFFLAKTLTHINQVIP